MLGQPRAPLPRQGSGSRGSVHSKALKGKDDDGGAIAIGSRLGQVIRLAVMSFPLPKGHKGPATVFMFHLFHSVKEGLDGGLVQRLAQLTKEPAAKKFMM